MAYLPPDTYRLVEQSMPIACVDFVLVQEHDGRRELGLILRESPHGEVWCHLGGRIQRGETIADAIRRHGRETLGVQIAAGTRPAKKDRFVTLGTKPGVNWARVEKAREYIGLKGYVTNLSTAMSTTREY